MGNEKTVKRPSLLLALLPVVLLIGMLYVVINVWEYDAPHMALIIAAIIASGIAIYLGHSWKAIEDRIISTITLAMQAILILLTVYILIATWMFSGTVPVLIYYGLQIISPGMFLFTACIICCVTSVACSSSWTTASTVGVALMGIAVGLGIPAPLAAGAIISGAYFGDKVSPLSDTTNLAAAMTGTNLFDHIKHIQWSTVPALLIALIIYLVLGFQFAGQGDSAQIGALTEAIRQTFNTNPLTLLPLVAIILIIVFKVPPLPGLFSGIGIAVLIAYITQWGYYDGFMDMTENMIIFMQEGFASSGLADLAEIGGDDSAAAMIQSLVERGGLDNVMWTVSLVLSAMCFGGVMEMSGSLEKIAQSLLKLAKGTGSLVTVSIVSCFFMNLLCSDQYLSILIPGRMYRKEFIKRGLNPKNLARCLEDGGTLTSPLVPWNTCGVAMAGFLGVSTLAYLPYVFMNLVSPFVGMFLGFSGIGIAKLTDEEKTALLAAEEK